VANKIDQMTQNDVKQDAEILELKAKLAEKKKGKEETKERTQLGVRTNELSKDIATKSEELKILQRNDPERIEELSKTSMTKRTRHQRHL
jgi:hypothetical protein